MLVEVTRSMTAVRKEREKAALRGSAGNEEFLTKERIEGSER
jgi:hypothetical protein